MIRPAITIYRIMTIILFILSQTANQDSLFGFADHLFREHQYQFAILEYRRLVFAGHPAESDYARGQIVQSLIHLQDYQDAVDEARKLARPDARNFDLGRVFYYAGASDSCRFHLSQVADTGAYPETRAYFGLSYARDFDFVPAARFLTLPARSRPQRRPVVAGLLSLVPGLGQVYAGRWGDGAYAFSILATGGAATYYYGHKEESLKFSLALVTTSVFYAANIYSAIVAAKNYNLYQNLSYFKEIEEDHLPSR
jgi:hypothetical protein